ncbi:MAG: alcohol dehydrogenase catalytic domain-containing protein [candidate division NC10 bacterium]|nr:alcohol dehydrogenase catalytic domain-containing protein [candidate division NC10 bacterium]
MRAAVVPSVHATWELREVPKPDPGPNQVLIKIRASGICYTDVHQTRGELPGDFPRILGHEPVGEVVAVGPGVTTRRIGDRVGVPWIQASCGRCEWCARGKPMFCAEQLGTSGQMPGGHAEYMLAYAGATVLLPTGLPDEQAAPIFCAGYTVWSGLRIAEPKPHERIAVVGIGGLGHLAVQYAKAAGFVTIAVSRSPDKDAFIRTLGADAIVRDGEGLAAAGGADVILGTSNSNDAMSDSLRGLRPDGRFVLMGYEAKPFPVPPADAILKRLRIIGSQQNGTEFLYEALDYAAKGKVKVIAETYRLDEVRKAYERVEKGQVRFRAVITLQ